RKEPKPQTKHVGLQPADIRHQHHWYAKYAAVNERACDPPQRRIDEERFVILQSGEAQIVSAKRKEQEGARARDPQGRLVREVPHHLSTPCALWSARAAGLDRATLRI